MFEEVIAKIAAMVFGWVPRPTILWWWNLTCPITRRWKIRQEEIDLLYAFAQRDRAYIDSIPQIKHFDSTSRLVKARYIQPIALAPSDFPVGRTFAESMTLIQDARFWASHFPTEAGWMRLIKEMDGKEGRYIPTDKERLAILEGAIVILATMPAKMELFDVNGNRIQYPTINPEISGDIDTIFDWVLRVREFIDSLPKSQLKERPE